MPVTTYPIKGKTDLPKQVTFIDVMKEWAVRGLQHMEQDIEDSKNLVQYLDSTPTNSSGVIYKWNLHE